MCANITNNTIGGCLEISCSYCVIGVIPTITFLPQNLYGLFNPSPNFESFLVNRRHCLAYDTTLAATNTSKYNNVWKKSLPTPKMSSRQPRLSAYTFEARKFATS